MKILVVDDDPGNQVLARRMLERHGGVELIRVVDGGEACLAAARLARFDTVLLDISMPDMDGVTACRRLRALPGYDTCRIIACTAHAGRDEPLRYRAEGFSATLTKPFLIEELYEAAGLPPAGQR